MPADKEFPVYDEKGLAGVLLAPARFLDSAPQKRLRLQDGSEVSVPSEDLEPQPDGSFFLKKRQVYESREGGQLTPVTTPTAEQLMREDCEVKRVPVRKLIDQPAEPRQEGDTLIFPLMEEVLVIEKRLMLREELHITRRREQAPNSKPIRKEDLESIY